MNPVFDMRDVAVVNNALPAPYAVNLIAFFQQQLRKIGAVLSGDAGDQCVFHGL